MTVRNLLGSAFAALSGDEAIASPIEDVAVFCFPAGDGHALRGSAAVRLAARPAAAEAALDLIDELEDQLTVFRDHSEVSRLNATAADRAVEVEPDLFDLIEFSAHITRQTHGAFDIATGALIKAWGFLPPRGPRADAGRAGEPPWAARAPGSSPWTATGGPSVILRQGLEINLGGIGKGYALDRAAELLAREWGVVLGLLARRIVERAGDRHAAGPAARLAGRDQAPVGPGPPARDGLPGRTALGTSAATFQHFEYNGRKLGHLLDPRTGWPAEGVEQASVVAPTAAEADALSTAFFVLGVEPTARFCRTRPDVGVVLLPAGQDRPLTFNLSPRRSLPPRRADRPRATRHDSQSPSGPPSSSSSSACASAGTSPTRGTARSSRPTWARRP